MKSFFEGIADLFVNVLFAPLDFLRFTDSWALANILNWLFMLIGSVAFVYWMLELKNTMKREKKTSQVLLTLTYK